MLDLAGIQADSIVDGPGIRTTVFCQGCPHHCPGCHNPETWEFGCGTPTEAETVLEIVRGNPLCRGVTFSGGEPFSQAEELARLGKMLKAAGYEVAAYSGYTLEQLPQTGMKLKVRIPGWCREPEVSGCAFRREDGFLVFDQNLEEMAFIKTNAAHISEAEVEEAKAFVLHVEEHFMK